jgi:hypothetical protein
MTDVMVVGLIVLATVIVALRTVLAVQRLTGTARYLRARTAELEGEPLDPAETFARVRLTLSAVSAAAERALWSLAGVDRRLDSAAARVAEWRVGSEHVRVRHLATADNLITRSRSVARAVKMAIELRRSLLV